MSCDSCGADVTQLESGYVCEECQTVVVDGITGWDVFDRRLFS